MKRERFPLTSDQMELLLAFEIAGSLETLADLMAKDASVISRHLQRLAGEHPVLAKTNGRWRLSPLGRQVNGLNRKYLGELGQLTKPLRRKVSSAMAVPENSLLVVINAQKALHDPARGRRSNTRAEENISRILTSWRKRRQPIVHVKHVSENPASFFYRESEGVEFIATFAPLKNEMIIEKSKASAFTGTNLEKVVHQIKTPALVLVGFTGGECIDATARQASDLGFETFVIGDATATFDIVGPKGKLIRAEKVHKNTLDHLHAFFAEVLETDSLLG